MAATAIAVTINRLIVTARGTCVDVILGGLSPRRTDGPVGCHLYKGGRSFIVIRGSGAPLRHDSTTRSFYRLTSKAALPATPFHGLRHVAATLQFALGARMEEVAELLGHEDESDMTRRYTHLLPASRQAAADRTNQLFPAKEQTT